MPVSYAFCPRALVASGVKAGTVERDARAYRLVRLPGPDPGPHDQTPPVGLRVDPAEGVVTA